MMATGFSRTLGALRSDRGYAVTLVGGLGGALLVAWVLWLFAGHVAVYRTSVRARLEVIPAPAPVVAQVAGRVVEVHLVVGVRVAAGDVVVALDTTAETIARERAKSQRATIEPELTSVARELVAEDEAGHNGAIADRESERVVLAQQREVMAALTHATEEEARTRGLVKTGAIPGADLPRAILETKQRRAALDALIHEANEREADRRQRDATRKTRREQLGRQHAELEAVLATKRAEIEQLDHEIERRTLRARVDGVLGEAAALRPGGVVAAGTVVATIVPDGSLQVVADYDPAAIGRIAPGQRARVRLDGFPWTHYGMLGARVARVSSELRDGVIRVELMLEPGDSAIAVAHGMTGTVEIEVEKASPAELLVRALGEGAR